MRFLCCYGQSQNLALMGSPELCANCQTPFVSGDPLLYLIWQSKSPHPLPEEPPLVLWEITGSTPFLVQLFSKHLRFLECYRMLKRCLGTIALQQKTLAHPEVTTHFPKSCLTLLPPERNPAASRKLILEVILSY